MAQKPLDADEISELSSSPYVSSIISGRITFTPEFKRVAYGLLVKGTPIREIFETHGIDPEILGNARMWGFAQKLRANPLCERCQEMGIKAGIPGGYIRAAHCVHHIVPIETATTMEGMRRLALHCGLDGLMSLCDQCHSEIHKQMKSYKKATVKQREADRHNRRMARLIERFTGQGGAEEAGA